MPNDSSNYLDDAGRLVVPPGKIVVRMYRQGLGDCFLLCFGGEKSKFVLIDCGVHARQTDGRDRLQTVLANIFEVTGGELDVVVATHEHADHLSGVVQKNSPFLRRAFTIQQLWLAWTEQPGDQLADKLRERRATARKIVERAAETATHTAAAAPSGLGVELTALSHQLQAASDFEQEPDGIDREAAYRLIREVESQSNRSQTRDLSRFQANRRSIPADEAVLGAGAAEQDRPTSNELAIGVLLAQARQVKYCRPGDLLKVNDIENVRVHVLGPPHDEAKLKKDLPSLVRGETGSDRFKETYLSSASQSLSFGLSPALGEGLVSRNQYPDDLRNPFDFPRRRHLEFNFPEDEQFDKMPAATRRMLDQSYFEARASWRRIDSDWLAASAHLALNLDSDTNNTSLVLAFEWENRVLLFVGDAQAGNWLSWRDQKYRDAAGNATISIDDLLERTVLYKVGHHGSQNATLKRDPHTATKEFPLGTPYGLEIMRNIIAMIPVDRQAAEKSMPSPWEMPYQPLYEQLRERAQRRVLRSDAVPNVRPLPEDAAPDIAPESIEFEPVPDLPGAQWRRSEQVLSSDDDPLFYEIIFS
ncbi:MBL fold metallo-hydrolase [Anatilimnocola sp. NA78]|uniref:MBL fold metallo-hydrolase n=1 Tax=Anatilimnocola sp. NA78 TaxID=3415683 RepID=UPI003CE4F77A